MTAAIAAEDQAYLAAQIIEHVGMPAVARYRPEYRAPHPGPGRALLACRCGRALDADQMHRYQPPRPTGRDLTIRPITCLECST